MARIIIVAMLLFGVAAGGLLYYQQVYAFYEDVEAEAIALTSATTGKVEDIAVTGFQGIDANSSPLRYRACFEIALDHNELVENYVVLVGTEPRVAPRWFDCFDAAQIGADLQAEAVAVMGTENIVYGIDRIVAIYPDGRGYAWHEINACGEVVFDGDPAPDGCPLPPESTN